LIGPTDAHPNLVDEIERIIRAQESAGWMVGDLMVKELGTNPDAVDDYVRNDLQPRLEARGLDVAYERLRAYYRVALINPPAQRNGVSFTAAEEAGPHRKRFEWYAQHGARLSKRDVRRLRGDRKLDTAAGSGLLSDAERAAQAVATLAGIGKDGLADALAKDNKLRALLSRAMRDVHADMAEETDRGSRTRAPGLNRARDFVVAMGHVDAAADRLNLAVQAMAGMELGPAQRTELGEALELVKHHLGWLDSMTGPADAMDNWLKGEAL
jgi:hypothetical protein